MRTPYVRHRIMLPILVVFLVAACSARGCGRAATSHVDSAAAIAAGPDVAPDAEMLAWESGDLPGKGWRCYTLVGHVSDFSGGHRGFFSGSYCARSLEDCLRKQPDTVDIDTFHRREECGRVQERAYCYKKQPKWDRITKIHCFQKMYECKHDLGRSCGPCNQVTECREFE